jgi:hypothetical protein
MPSSWTWSTNDKATHKHTQVTLGKMMRSTIKVVFFWFRMPHLNPKCYLKYTPLPWKVIMGFKKHMIGLSIHSFEKA